MTEPFAHKKSLGQHFLNSDYVPQLLVTAAWPLQTQTILEIGPGTGALTVELLKTGATVCALETDTRALLELEARFPEEITARQLRLAAGDMRTLDAEAVAKIFDLRDHAYTLIANIPYYLSGHLFRMFLETPIQPDKIVFLVQREIAERIARDRKESLLSLSVKAFGNPSYIKTIKRTHFTPPPKVDSAIILIDQVSHDNFASNVEMKAFFDLIHLGFAAKRKQLLGNLSKSYSRDQLVHIFSTLALAPDVRAEDISLEIWLKLNAQLLSTAHN